MTTEVQWKCKDDHGGCEGKDWKFYKLFSETDAKDFIERIGPNSKHFLFRINPEKYEATNLKANP